jgi:hypothetical protein
VNVLHGRDPGPQRRHVIEDVAAFNATVYEEVKLSLESAIQKLFERFNVSTDDFNRTWKSFEVVQKLRIASNLARRCSVANSPIVVVNGKFRTGGQETGSNQKLLELIDELIVRESARQPLSSATIHRALPDKLHGDDRAIYVHDLLPEAAQVEGTV